MCELIKVILEHLVDAVDIMTISLERASNNYLTSTSMIGE